MNPETWHHANGFSPGACLSTHRHSGTTEPLCASIGTRARLAVTRPAESPIQILDQSVSGWKVGSAYSCRCRKPHRHICRMWRVPIRTMLSLSSARSSQIFNPALATRNVGSQTTHVLEVSLLNQRFLRCPTFPTSLRSGKPLRATAGASCAQPNAPRLHAASIVVTVTLINGWDKFFQSYSRIPAFQRGTGMPNTVRGFRNSAGLAGLIQAARRKRSHATAVCRT
jgi:hypothetical protein